MACSVVPMKYATKWRWENIWLLYVGFAQVVFPVILVALTVPNAWEALGAASKAALVSALLFGLGWGMGNVLAGIAYAMLGVGLGLSVNLGLTASMGSLVPLAILFPARLVSSSAVALYVGVATMLGGLILSAQAGVCAGPSGSRANNQRSRREGLWQGQYSDRPDRMCGGGIPVRACWNLSFAFGDNVRVTALRLGASATGAVNTLWLPILIAGFIPTLIYCAYLLNKNHSWAAFVAPGVASHWGIAALMGFLFMSALTLYGIASVRLGAMGPVLGFPIFMSTIVLTGNTAGLHWRVEGAPKNAFVYWFLGMLLLVLSIVIIGIGNSRAG